MVLFRSNESRSDAFGAAARAGLIVLFTLLTSNARADPISDDGGAQPTPPQLENSQIRARQNTSSTIRDDIQRVARALETKNSYDQSPQGQHDAHEAAQAARDAANATVALFIVTGLLWLFTAFMWWETKGIARDARRQFEAEHRPWLGIEDEKITRSFNLFTEITTIVFDFEIRNTGKIPATNVVIETDAIRLDDQADVSSRIAELKMTAIARQLSRRSDDRMIGSLLLPGKTPMTQPVAISNIPIKNFPSHPRLAEFTCIILGVCCYNSPTDDIVRFSSFAFRLEAPGGYIEINPHNVGARGQVDGSTMIFVRWPVGWSAE